MSIPVPQDPIIRKLDRLAQSVVRPEKRQPRLLKINQRVVLQSADADNPHTGTVTNVDDRGFDVTWDSPDRKRGQARMRLRYSWNEAHNFGGSSVK